MTLCDLQCVMSQPSSHVDSDLSFEVQPCQLSDKSSPGLTSVGTGKRFKFLNP